MTLAEFKAWFEGYTEAIEGAPTAAQFDKIKKKVATLNVATTGLNYPPNVRGGPWVEKLSGDAQSGDLGDIPTNGHALGNFRAAGSLK